MAEKVLMIALSPTMEEGTIVHWNKSEGEQVTSGELLCEVETDKATMEYESPAEGTILKILVPEGGGAKVAEPIAVVGEKGEDISDLLKEVEAAEPSAAGAASPPAPPSAPSPPPEASVPTGPAEPSTGGAAPAAAPAGGAARTSDGRIKASPLARRLAEEKGIDLAQVPGSGPGGRIVKRDIEGYQPRPAAVPTGPIGPAGPIGGPQLVEEQIPVTGKRKVIAQRLAESKFQAPHYYLKVTIGMDGLIDARKRLNAGLEDTKVSFNAFIMKFAAEALKRHPMVNSSWQGEHIQKFGRIDMGLAVAVPDGLITPVVRDCGNKGVLAIERDLKELIPKAQQGRLLPEEYKGATFTVTNLGSFGIEEFTAIINPPGSAILALGMTQRQPVVVRSASGGDEIEVRSLMKATLSCDHRVVDGATGAAFLTGLKSMIENPIEALY